LTVGRHRTSIFRKMYFGNYISENASFLIFRFYGRIIVTLAPSAESLVFNSQAGQGQCCTRFDSAFNNNAIKVALTHAAMVRSY